MPVAIVVGRGFGIPSTAAGSSGASATANELLTLTIAALAGISGSGLTAPLSSLAAITDFPSAAIGVIFLDPFRNDLVRIGILMLYD